MTFYEICDRILIELYKEYITMDYEKIILELYGRIKSLEERVDALENDAQISDKPSITTDEICSYINSLKELAKKDGSTAVVLVSRDVHNQLNLKSRYPMVCNAMRKCMGENDRILFQPPKGNSSTLEIEYIL